MFPHCVIVGDDAPLAAALVWSLPVEQIDGFTLLGGKALGQHGRLPGGEGHVPVDLSDRPSATAALAGLIRRRGVSPVLAIGADDAGCALLADLTLDGLIVAPVADGQTLRRLGDKWAFHQLCQTLGLPVPATEWAATKTGIDIRQSLAEHDGAVVIKPTNRHGGDGVVLVRSAEAFDRLVLDNPDYDHAPLVVQAFVPGRDLDISLLALDGQILHRAIQAREGHDLRFLDHAQLAAVVEALVLHTAFSGLAHIDARWLDDGSVILLECNTRPWATLSKATWCGLNFVRATVEAAQGRPRGEQAVLASGLAPRPDAWVLAALPRPWRYLALGRDQKRILLGAGHAFATLGWDRRWDRFRALFRTRDDR